MTPNRTNSIHVRIIPVLIAILSLFSFEIRADIVNAILNGTQSSLDKIPYQVKLIITKGSSQYLCGGSIIDDGVILTAAHCLYQDSSGNTTNSIQITYRDYTNSSSPTTKTVTATSAQFDYNPNWLGDLDDSSDIAVIYLSSEPFANAKKIKIADSDEITQMYTEFASTYVANQDNETNVQASGYGTDEDGNYGTLNRVLLTGIPASTCQSISTDDVSGNDIICVTSPSQTINYGICSGDSGGPLIWQNPSNTSDADYGVRLVGVASFTTVDSDGNCVLNGTNAYGGYTSINFFKSYVDGAIEDLSGITDYDYDSLAITYAFSSNPMLSQNTSGTSSSYSSNSQTTTSGGGGATGLLMIVLLGGIALFRRQSMKE